MIGEEFAFVLARAQRGHEDAFERLWRDLNPALVRYLTVAGEPAEDVAAETWASVIQGLARFRGDEAGWRAWVFTTARRRAVDLARKRSREERGPASLGDRPGWAGGADLSEAGSGGWPVTPREHLARDCAEEAIEGMDTDTALRLVALLPPLQAEVVMLRVVGGLPVSAVARLLDRSPGAVRVAAHRGLRQLGRMLAEGTPARDGERRTSAPTTDPAAAPTSAVTLRAVPSLRE